MRERIAGILGGMGPEATLDLMRRVIESTPARRDADHVRMVVDNNPRVPSRMKALLDGTGESPAACLGEMARRLEAWGVDFLAMPCNAAHYYYGEICAGVTVPFLNMVEMTVERVAGNMPGLGNAGLLSTTAVMDMGLYTDYFKDKDIKVLSPSTDIQGHLMESIRRIKAGTGFGEAGENVRRAADDLVKSGAEVLIIACTDLSIISRELDAGLEVYDASQVLAEGVIRWAKGDAVS